MEGWQTGVFALGGIGLGWLLGRTDNWLKRKEEDRKIYRRRLSILLDVRQAPSGLRAVLEWREMVLLNALEFNRRRVSRSGPCRPGTG